jgi:hypothetical protein
MPWLAKAFNDPLQFDVQCTAFLNARRSTTTTSSTLAFLCLATPRPAAAKLSA